MFTLYISHYSGKPLVSRVSVTLGPGPTLLRSVRVKVCCSRTLTLHFTKIGVAHRRTRRAQQTNTHAAARVGVGCVWSLGRASTTREEANQKKWYGFDLAAHISGVSHPVSSSLQEVRVTVLEGHWSERWGGAREEMDQNSDHIRCLLLNAGLCAGSLALTVLFAIYGDSQAHGILHSLKASEAPCRALWIPAARILTDKMLGKCRSRWLKWKNKFHEDISHVWEAEEESVYLWQSPLL